MNTGRIFAASILLGAAACAFSGCGSAVGVDVDDGGYYGPGYVGTGFYGGAWYGGGDRYVHPPRGGDDGHGHPSPGIPHNSRPAPARSAPRASGGGGGDRRR